ncbi:MAG: formaldehyde dehydrogenase, glutathione-independent, partial [Nitrococcus sp.]|nr:formaldehyde dehydrogenase, glutathione-independent [Nitrococcus sp.]
AMAKIKDLTLLSDILPTGFHGCVTAGVGVGSTVYIAGAGPVGRCAAVSAQLLGASCIIVGDTNKERLALVKNAGYEVVDLSKEDPLADQIEAILGQREVDCGVDCVGYEAHGHGPGAADDPAAVLNGLMEVVRANGAMGIPGIYTAGDAEAKSEAVKQGTYALDFGKAWIKSPHMTAGQAPIKKYNRELMMGILWDRMPNLGKIANIEIITLEKAPEAYRLFDEGSPKKFVIDPHGSLKKVA